MAAHLVLFATSERPDPYVNCIAHAVNFNGVRSAQIVVIAGTGAEPTRDAERRASTVLKRVFEQLEVLSGGAYASRDGTMVPLPPESAEQYKKVRKSLDEGGIGSKTVSYDSLFEELRELCARENVIFDVTSLKNSHLVDVASILLALDCRRLYTFELLKAPTFDENDLIHALHPGTQYAYREITEGAQVVKAVRRLTRWTARVKWIGIFVAGTAILSMIMSYVFDFQTISAVMGYVGSFLTIVAFLLLFVRDKYSG